jgi:50S ribosomal subunit-associated GTPase HflX
LVGNKVDREGRQIQRDEVLQYAEEIHAVYFETSAQENIGCEELLEQIADMIIQAKEFTSLPPDEQKKRIAPAAASTQTQKGCEC